MTYRVDADTYGFSHRHDKKGKNVIYTFNRNRLCNYCNQDKPRSHGKELPDKTWACFTCKKPLGY